jgi:hypothetical protein
MEQGGEHAEGEQHAAAAEIADHVDRRHRPVARPPEGVKCARQRDIVDVVARLLRERAVLPPAGHAAIDEARIVGEQPVGA